MRIASTWRRNWATNSPLFQLRSARPAAGKFEIYKGGGKTGGYRWRLKSRNGEIVASGEAYETKAGAKKGVDAVQRAAARRQG